MLTSLGELWDSVSSLAGVRLFPIGETPITIGGVVRVVVIVALAALVSRGARSTLGLAGTRWVSSSRSALYTLNRLVHYTIITVGLAIGLATMGVDFTNLTVLVGALGIGVGFGLQDVVANFIAGLIILFERHLRVGDFVELESGVAGEVREILMRATRVVTNDNVNVLVPNSEFVRGRVLNWTLDEADRRIHVPFGVAYGSDKDQVRAAGLEAAGRVGFTLQGIPPRAPQVWLVRFGESTLDFELVVWVTQDGVMRPGAARAAYLWEIHTTLQQRGIQIAFPQRDLHLRSLFGLEGQDAQALLHARRPPPPAIAADR